MSKNTLIVVLLAVSAFALGIARCGGKPDYIHKVWPTGYPLPSQTVTFEVGLDQVVSGTQVVNLSSPTPSNFSSLPPTVTVTNGQSCATFQATISSSATGSVEVEASCNGETVGIQFAIAQRG